MTPLWIAIALLLLPALWLLVAPMRGARTLRDKLDHFEANDTADEQNVAIFKRRLASLEAAHERGDMDEERFKEDCLELERSLLEDTATRTKRPLRAATAGRLAVPLVMVAVVGASTFWYQQNGAEGDLTLYAIQQEVQSDPDGSLAMYLERMEAEAARQPNNPNVWSSLFPLYRETGQADKAADALERLIAIEGRVPPLLAQLAQLRFFMAERELTPEVQSLVDETLAQDPRQPTVLGLLGIHAFDNGDYETAIDRWRRAVANIEDPDTASSLREGIRVAQERLGISPETAAVEAAQRQGVRVNVSLDKALLDNVSGDASVFITARDIEGELPPLAVIRAQVSELPMTVVLDDTAAMSPQAQISQVREARLVVRVSQSGQATPQPGDLFGDLESVNVGPISEDETANVVIDRVFE
ncbi:c-type cytochrome biogenesis protein CcmI [Vreelandella andesensis]|uniref:C-type cytochrome biogenesis protein CcmI n=1 Tax=Vreelandella andesensis TaxID=447567 RepID=A0A433KUE4_9GAMM|nr:c-type cytochrome biogenesis protein CcmI [Halomonas andesensis]RUR33261.1 c-type cytochrome biogenesis protein CcmI [Halomonas andesensis]